MSGRPAKWASVVVGFLAAFWLIGCYISTVSNWWVSLGLLAPAGADHVLTFPGARPAVGMTLPTIFSLLGLLALIYAGLRWFAYIRQDEYLPPVRPVPRTQTPAPAPAPGPAPGPPPGFTGAAPASGPPTTPGIPTTPPLSGPPSGPDAPPAARS